jgi:hypothetical protein
MYHTNYCDCPKCILKEQLASQKAKKGVSMAKIENFEIQILKSARVNGQLENVDNVLEIAVEYQKKGKGIQIFSMTDAEGAEVQVDNDTIKSIKDKIISFYKPTRRK